MQLEMGADRKRTRKEESRERLLLAVAARSPSSSSRSVSLVWGLSSISKSSRFMHNSFQKLLVELVSRLGPRAEASHILKNDVLVVMG